MTNLATVLSAAPHLADRVVVTQQGGWLDRYRDKTRASHNLRLDTRAAGLALRAASRPRLLLSDFTGADDITITPNPSCIEWSPHPMSRIGHGG